MKFTGALPFVPKTCVWCHKTFLPIRLIEKMKQDTSKNVNNSLNTNIDSYFETSGGQSYNLYLNVTHFFNTRVD